MNEELTHPDLYRRADGATADRATVALLGMTCSSCGHVTFPRQQYGCEKCGASGESLRDVDLCSSGTLTSFATVHMHQAKTITAPFVIGDVALDDGPTVRATMVESTDTAMRIGARVTGCLFPAPSASDASSSKLELRFSLCSSLEAALGARP